MVFETLSVIAALATSLRLLMFRRQGRRFKRSVSVAAWLVANGTAAAALLIVTQGLPAGAVGGLTTATLCTLAVLTWKAGGNLISIADILRRQTRWLHH